MDRGVGLSSLRSPGQLSAYTVRIAQLPVSRSIWFSHQAKPRSSERARARPGDAKM